MYPTSEFWAAREWYSRAYPPGRSESVRVYDAPGISSYKLNFQPYGSEVTWQRYRVTSGCKPGSKCCPCKLEHRDVYVRFVMRERSYGLNWAESSFKSSRTPPKGMPSIR